MGLKRIVGIRQFTGFNAAQKMEKFYRITFETEKTVGEFTFDIPVSEYTAKLATDTAKVRAHEIDAAIEEPRTAPAKP